MQTFYHSAVFLGNRQLLKTLFLLRDNYKNFIIASMANVIEYCDPKASFVTIVSTLSYLMMAPEENDSTTTALWATSVAVGIYAFHIFRWTASLRPYTEPPSYTPICETSSYPTRDPNFEEAFKKAHDRLMSNGKIPDDLRYNPSQQDLEGGVCFGLAFVFLRALSEKPEAELSEIVSALDLTEIIYASLIQYVENRVYLLLAKAAEKLLRCFLVGKTILTSKSAAILIFSPGKKILVLPANPKRKLHGKNLLAAMSKITPLLKVG